MPRYSRSKQPSFFKQHKFEETSIAVTVYHLGAFADAIGAHPNHLRHILASERTSRPRNHCKGWAFAYPEEIDESKQIGGHYYMVYGRRQDEPPTEDQLNNPPERLVRKKSPDSAHRNRLWCIDPDRTLYVVWGIAAFAELCDFNPSNIARIKKGQIEDNGINRDWFVPRGTRVQKARHFVGLTVGLDRQNPVDAGPGDRGYLQKVRAVYSNCVESKDPYKWRIVHLGELIKVAREGLPFETLIYGEPFDGKPDDGDLERLGVKWNDLFPWEAWKYFELGEKTSDKVG